MSLKPLEQTIKEYLSDKNVNFVDNTESFKDMDFVISPNNLPTFSIEVKEKRKPYNPNNWPKLIDEEDLFIIDDLTVRKCLAHSPCGGVIVRVNHLNSYYFFSIVDFALMPKARVNRSIYRKNLELKGKWLINLNNGKKENDVNAVFSQIGNYLRDLDNILYEYKPCFGDFPDEEINQGGITRKPSHWKDDVTSTR